MSTGHMPGLAQFIKSHKKKSHILKSMLDKSVGQPMGTTAATDACPVLHDAIGELRPDQLRRQSVPAAIAELHEIRLMTVSCVDVIMSKAENLMELEPAMDDAISILEACSFQDIVGQRLAKVTELLETLEERFHSLVHETGIADKLDAVSDEELDIERRRKEQILHGPQATGDGVSQDEIDALLGA